jgi:protein-tyrosine phosphatase
MCYCTLFPFRLLFLVLVILSPQMSSIMSDACSIKPVQAQPPRPNDCTYWVTDRLLAGEHPTVKYGDSRKKLKQYLDRGITYFVDLTHEGERADYFDMIEKEAINMNLPQQVQYKRCAIPDFGIPSKEGMKEILDTIDKALGANHKVYVHCRGGIGRTGTTVGCYLARHGSTGDEALQQVNRLFQCSDRKMEVIMTPETSEQIQFVRNWRE